MTGEGASVAALGLADELEAFEAALALELRSDVAFIGAIGEDLVRAGGKRVRPTLAMLAGRLLGAAPESTRVVALAVEMLHSASLLHDDLIDGAATRRGSSTPTCRADLRVYCFDPGAAGRGCRYLVGTSRSAAGPCA